MLMTIVTSIVAGILLGFAASARTATDGLEDLTRNVTFGTIGAFVGLKVFAGVFASPESGSSGLTISIGAILGASLAIFVINRLRKA